MARTALFAVVLLCAAVPRATAVTNPHVDGDSSCLSCHVQGFETANEYDYSLRGESVDSVCLRCHEKAECCTVGQKHMEIGFIGISHPSDLDARKIQRASLPKTLPLQDGKMTCNTCHFHRRPAGRDYKLVRLVTFTDTGAQWTRLCQDCHSDK